MGENVVLGLFAATPVLVGFALFKLARRKNGSRAKTKKKTSGASLVLGNSLVLLFLLSLGLLAGEIYFRFGYDTTDSVNFTKVSRRWFARYWNTNGNQNKFGCRDNVEYNIQSA